MEGSLGAFTNDFDLRIRTRKLNYKFMYHIGENFMVLKVQ